MRDGFSADDEDGSTLEFDDDSSLGSRHLRRLRRAIVRTLPVLLLTALLLAVAGQPELAALFHRTPDDAPVPITVVCDVPWALIRVDGRGPVNSCHQGVAGALPMARLSVPVGQHTLIATADGFAPYPIYIVAHAGTPGLYLTEFSLTSQGTTDALDAVNSFFATAYEQVVTLPASLWRALGLRAAPSGSALVVHERFEAVALDAYEPFYTETTYQRPIAPEPGTVGVAAVVREHVTIYDACDTTPLLERRMPVLYTTRASVTFSLRLGAQHWTATRPYALNPTADIFTAPDVAATPITPDYLLALTARTALSNWLGSRSLVAGAITAVPLTSQSAWSDGVVLTQRTSMQSAPQATDGPSVAIWLYTGGVLLAFTAAAHTLSPGVAAPALSVAEVQASLAHPPVRDCGGE
ncbi:MAG TPA: hypothetical protein VFS83_04490 [Ktedonobacterales bacterium]|nr:hypothetical protein [Ktedonobacterales bacterium]